MHNHTYNSFKNYLTENQYNKICKYISVIDAIKNKLFDIMDNYPSFEYEQLKGRLTYYQDEYLNYLDEISIGHQLFDLQDKELFELIHHPFHYIIPNKLSSNMEYRPRLNLQPEQHQQSGTCNLSRIDTH
jgi:hypothetical protein